MYATIPPGGFEVKKRTLSSDEIKAVCDIYPASANQYTCDLDTPQDGCGCSASASRAAHGVRVVLPGSGGGRRRVADGASDRAGPGWSLSGGTEARRCSGQRVRSSRCCWSQGVVAVDVVGLAEPPARAAPRGRRAPAARSGLPGRLETGGTSGAAGSVVTGGTSGAAGSGGSGAGGSGGICQTARIQYEPRSRRPTWWSIGRRACSTASPRARLSAPTRRTRHGPRSKRGRGGGHATGFAGPFRLHDDLRNQSCRRWNVPDHERDAHRRRRPCAQQRGRHQGEVRRSRMAE
jgi:hypothetical protein